VKDKGYYLSRDNPAPPESNGMGMCQHPVGSPGGYRLKDCANNLARAHNGEPGGESGPCQN